MSSKRKGTEFEREVKKLFTDAGWYCTRAAASMSPMDLIAYTEWKKEWRYSHEFILIWGGYRCRRYNGTKIPLDVVWTKRDGLNTKKVYLSSTSGVGNRYAVVLMQCKINKRRRKK